ncbi:hypothetical protein [Dendrosporobacter sp. 1207_IL3150]|uniref:hypothetical protein n=1 Tax=Dendrosporobacter sp. 1207_IL3150 TaxID=3084054 RepID=UPI002FD9C389
MILDKKLKEISIVNLIYSDVEYQITPSEEPDFIIINKKAKYSFGVEVTEYYHNESNARIRNIPNYGSKNAKDVTIQSPPDVDVYVRGITERIMAKNEKLNHYDLLPINLIIMDTENFFSNTIYRDEVYNNLFNDDLKRQIIRSGFREIYLITEVDWGKQVYIPLKLIYFVAELNLLMQFIDERHPELHKISEKEFLAIGAQYFILQGVQELQYAEIDDKFQIAYSNYAVSLLPDKIFQIKDYYEAHLPEEFVPVDFVSDVSMIDDNFINSIRLYSKTHTLNFKIGYEVITCD